MTKLDHSDPLSGLDAIDWSNLSHAYGPATDVPALLRDVANGPAEARRKALWELWGNIHHQGTVYQASAPAIPFLARLAGDHAVPADVRAQLISLIAAIASGRSYLEVHEPSIRGGLTDEGRQAMAQELDWAARAHESAAAVASSLLKHLSSDDPTISWPLVGLAAQVPEAAKDAAPALRAMSRSSSHPMREKALKLTLGLIDDSVDADDIRDVATISGDLASLADPAEWRTVTQGAKYIVTVLLEEAGESR